MVVDHYFVWTPDASPNGEIDRKYCSKASIKCRASRFVRKTSTSSQAKAEWSSGRQICIAEVQHVRRGVTPLLLPRKRRGAGPRVEKHRLRRSASRSRPVCSVLCGIETGRGWVRQNPESRRHAVDAPEPPVCVRSTVAQRAGCAHRCRGADTGGRVDFSGLRGVPCVVGDAASRRGRTTPAPRRGLPRWCTATAAT